MSRRVWETKKDREKRLSAETWQRYKDTIETIDSEFRAAREDRDASLSEIRDWCDSKRKEAISRARKEVTKRCNEERQPVRETARETLHRLDRERKAAYAQARAERMPDLRYRATPEPLSRAESDQMVEMHLPEGVPVEAWRQVRSQFDYTKSPDWRLEQFHEYLHDDGFFEIAEGDINLMAATMFEKSPREYEAMDIRRQAADYGLDPNAPISQLEKELTRIVEAEIKMEASDDPLPF